MKESDILKQVRDYLRWRGFFVIRIQQGLGSHPGMPDLIAVKEGKMFFLEIKTPKGKLSEHQKKFYYELVSHGFTNYHVLTSIEDCGRLLQ